MEYLSVHMASVHELNKMAKEAKRLFRRQDYEGAMDCFQKIDEYLTRIKEDAEFALDKSGALQAHVRLTSLLGRSL